MKKIYALLASSAIIGQMYAQNPVIVNADFEDGFRTVNATSNLPPASISSTTPNGWYCSDSLLVGMAPILALGGFNFTNFVEQCFESTNAASGSAAVAIETSILNDTLQLPGLLANAKMSVDLGVISNGGSLEEALSFTGGTPANKKEVVTITAKVFLDTMNREDGSVSVMLYGKHPGTNEYGVMGSGVAVVSPDTVYQDVTVTVSYIDPTFTAVDTMVILLSSTTSYEVTAGNPKNYMVVDDINGTYTEGKIPVSVGSLTKNNAIKMYPVPATSTLTIENTQYTAGTQYVANILSIDGKLLQQVALTNATQILDVSALNTGLYVVELVADNQKVFIQKFSKN